MRVVDLLPGMRFTNPIIGPAVYIAHCPHPYYAGLQLVVWRLERDNSISLDALHAHQDVGEPEPFAGTVLRENVRKAIGIQLAGDTS